MTFREKIKSYFEEFFKALGRIILGLILLCLLGLAVSFVYTAFFESNEAKTKELACNKTMEWVKKNPDNRPIPIQGRTRCGAILPQQNSCFSVEVQYGVTTISSVRIRSGIPIPSTSWISSSSRVILACSDKAGWSFNDRDGASQEADPLISLSMEANKTANNTPISLSEATDSFRKVCLDGQLNANFIEYAPIGSYVSQRKLEVCDCIAKHIFSNFTQGELTLWQENSSPVSDINLKFKALEKNALKICGVAAH